MSGAAWRVDCRTKVATAASRVGTTRTRAATRPAGPPRPAPGARRRPADSRGHRDSGPVETDGCWDCDGGSVSATVTSAGTWTTGGDDGGGETPAEQCGVPIAARWIGQRLRLRLRGVQRGVQLDSRRRAATRSISACDCICAVTDCGGSITGGVTDQRRRRGLGWRRLDDRRQRRRARHRRAATTEGHRDPGSDGG